MPKLAATMPAPASRPQATAAGNAGRGPRTTAKHAAATSENRKARPKTRAGCLSAPGPAGIACFALPGVQEQRLGIPGTSEHERCEGSDKDSPPIDLCHGLLLQEERAARRPPVNKIRQAVKVTIEAIARP